MSKGKGILNPISASNQAVTLLVDASHPLILELQLFWFVPEIGIFLEKEMFWESSNRIRIGSFLDFKYTPSKMETGYVGYLLGFGSNMHKECYNKTIVRFATEDEKLRHAELIKSAVNELVQAAMSIKASSSPWFEWDIGKKES